MNLYLFKYVQNLQAYSALKKKSIFHIAAK
jgi:hypothetical protein